jgi:hypothetical protein
VKNEEKVLMQSTRTTTFAAPIKNRVTEKKERRKKRRVGKSERAKKQKLTIRLTR